MLKFRLAVRRNDNTYAVRRAGAAGGGGRRGLNTFENLPTEIKAQVFKERYDIMKHDKYKRQFDRVIRELNVFTIIFKRIHYNNI